MRCLYRIHINKQPQLERNIMIKHKNTLNKVATDFPTGSIAIGAGTGAAATLLARKLMGGDMSWKDYLLWGALGATGGGVLGALVGGVGSDADQPSVKKETDDTTSDSKSQSNKSEQPPTAGDEWAKLWQQTKAGMWSGTKALLPTLAEIGTGAAALGIDGPKKWGIYGVGFNLLNWIGKGSDKVENYVNAVKDDVKSDIWHKTQQHEKNKKSYGGDQKAQQAEIDNAKSRLQRAQKELNDLETKLKGKGIDPAIADNESLMDTRRKLKDIELDIDSRKVNIELLDKSEQAIKDAKARLDKLEVDGLPEVKKRSFFNKKTGNYVSRHRPTFKAQSARLGLTAGKLGINRLLWYLLNNAFEKL